MLQNYDSIFWMINPSSMAQLATPMLRALKGEHAVKGEVDLPQPYSVSSNGNTASEDSKNREEGLVAILPLKGVILKYSDWYVTGMDRFSTWIEETAGNPRVKAIILDVDTPGGSSAACPKVIAAIEAAKLVKPVIAYVGDGMCASAGYWISCHCTEIIASYDTDLSGSIGTYLTLYDFKAYYASMGLPVHEIYATLSTDKNKIFAEALAGKPERLRTEFIDPVNEAFLSDVVANRGDKLDKKVLEGGIFYTKDALSFGLIDSVKTFADTITYAFEVANETDNNMFSKHKATTALLGASPESRTEEMIAAAVAEFAEKGIVTTLKPDASAEALDSVTTERDEIQSVVEKAAESLGLDKEGLTSESLNEAITGLQAKIGTLETENAGLKTQVATLSKKPVTTSTTTTTETTTEEVDTPTDAKALMDSLPHNQAADKFLKSTPKK